MKNVGGNVSKKYLIQFSLSKLVQLFQKSIGSTFYEKCWFKFLLKTAVTFFNQ
jgi:hypothetical protein